MEPVQGHPAAGHFSGVTLPPLEPPEQAGLLRREEEGPEERPLENKTPGLSKTLDLGLGSSLPGPNVLPIRRNTNNIFIKEWIPLKSSHTHAHTHTHDYSFSMFINIKNFTGKSPLSASLRTSTPAFLFLLHHSLLPFFLVSIRKNKRGD